MFYIVEATALEMRISISFMVKRNQPWPMETSKTVYHLQSFNCNLTRGLTLGIGVDVGELVAENLSMASCTDIGFLSTSDMLPSKSPCPIITRAIKSVFVEVANFSIPSSREVAEGSSSSSNFKIE